MQGRRLLAGGVGAALLVAGLAGVAESAAEDKGVLVAAPDSPYTVGMTPYSIVSADLDLDGDLDFATADTNTASISVFLGDGAGAFVPAAGSPYGGAHSAEMRVGFVNGDALPDLVAIRKEPNCCGNTDYLLTLLGTGGGAFAAAVEGPVIGPAAGDGLTLGDVTGDGVVDALYTNTFSLIDTHQHVFGVLKGNGNGTWTGIGEYVERELPYPLTNGPSGIAIGDLDGDGDRDVVLANNGTKDVSVWRNDGTGAFARIGTPIPLARFTGDVVLLDADTDGDLDALVGNTNYDSVSLLLNAGNGALSSAAWSPISVPGGAADLALGDLNDDGSLDLVAGYPGQIRVMLGDGTGQFTSGWGSPYTAANLSDVTVGDVNGDGFDDVLRTNNSLDEAHVLLTALDAVGPTTSISVDPVAPQSGWYTGGVSVGVFAVDNGPAGVAAMRCTLDPFGVPTGYGDLPPSCSTSFPISADGVHHAYGAAVDRAGNVGPLEQREVKIDSVLPSLSLSTNPPAPGSGWFKAEPFVIMSAADATSGIAEVRCLVDPSDPPATYDEMSGCPDSFPVVGSGVHHVYGAARDVAGNTTAISHLVVQVDTIAPVLDVAVEPSTVVRGHPVAVIPQASDGLSGLDHVDCNPAPTDVVGTQLIVQCVAYDVAGNANQQFGFYDVTPADVTVHVSSAKAAGARLAVTTLLGTDGLVDSADVTVTVPGSLRVDTVPVGCAKTVTGMTCAVGQLDPGDAPSLTMLVSPRGPGPHLINVHVEVPDDPVPASNDDDTGISVSTVCDNVPTSLDDPVAGGSGADILCGLGGNDTFRGLGGNDLIFGGPGIDTVSYAGSPSPVAVDLRLQGLGLIGAKPRSGAGHGSDSFTGIENATGTGLADLLTGNGLVNRLLGGLGVDVLLGLAGNDRLEGGGGNDSLTGGTGRDVLIGGAGTDTCRESTDNRSSCEKP